MSDESLPEHVAANRQMWDERAADWVASGERAWARKEPTWGVWGVPEADLRMLPTDMTGTTAVELGCGTGYVSGWMARRGATVSAIDNSSEQLATARRLADRHGASIAFVHGNAERTPYPDSAFDFAISEYGAAIWCDPEAWIPEAHRILKPGGRLVFLGNHPLMAVCSPWDGSQVVDRLVRPYFNVRRLDWRTVEFDPGGVEFNLPTSGWFELFERVGFVVEGYAEPRPTEPGEDVQFAVSQRWAYDYPSEHVWKVRKV
jgi:SAM-dependent methyltransferase